MTFKQANLLRQIKQQREIVARFPSDPVEQVALDTLLASLRDTFCIVPGEAQSPSYHYSKSRAVLKLLA